MNLKVSKVVVEKGELLIIELPSEKTKAIAICGECKKEMLVQRIPRTEKIEQAKVRLLFHAFHCDFCNGPYWDIDGILLDLNIKRKEIVNESNRINNDAERQSI